MTGYGDPSYVESLSGFGEIRRLPHCGGAVLVRQIPGCLDRDAMGAYPLFACKDWSKLHVDLDEIGEDLVSLAMVPDPHGSYNKELLHRCFSRVVRFKEHYVVDLTRPLEKIGRVGHRKKALRALREVEIELCVDPARFLDDWCALYEVLARRHDIRGIRAFSRSAFLKQLGMPGVAVLKALHREAVVGALVFLLRDDVAYGHLCAMSELGYKLRATYALDMASFEYFSGKVRMIDLGGGMTMAGGDSDGLGAYKQGWATRTCPVYFCGRIFNAGRYEAISRAKGIGETNYFPSYRNGEFSQPRNEGGQR